MKRCRGCGEYDENCGCKENPTDSISALNENISALNERYKKIVSQMQFTVSNMSPLSIHYKSYDKLDRDYIFLNYLVTELEKVRTILNGLMYINSNPTTGSDKVDKHLCMKCGKKNSCLILRNVVETLNQNDFVGTFTIKDCKAYENVDATSKFYGR